MGLSRLECTLAVIAVVCVLMIFFFPSVQGPYPVVHGPVTALLAARAAAGLRMAMTGLKLVRSRLSEMSVALYPAGWNAGFSPDFPLSSRSTASSSVLRC